MGTSSHTYNQLLHQIVAKQILCKVTKFGGVCSHIKTVMDVQSRRAQFG